MITRRVVALRGLPALAAACACCGRRAVAKSTNAADLQAAADIGLRGSFGCVIAAQPVSELFARTPESVASASFASATPRSGNPAFDYALAQTLSRITETLRVLPGFVFYDDHESANAFATPRKRFARTDGTVLFGLTFLRQLLDRRDDGEIALTAICAHEFAHIAQFKHGVVSATAEGGLTVEQLELHADFLAGYFAGARKKAKRRYPSEVFANTLSSLNPAGKRRSHGTPEQRAAAIQQGFDTAYRDGRSLDEAFALATQYVTAAQ